MPYFNTQKMKKRIAPIVIFLLTTVITYAQNNKIKINSITNKTVPAEITIKPFPILSFIPPALTEQQLNWFREAGFNVMTIHPDDKDYSIMKKYWDGNYMLFKDFQNKGYDYRTMADFHAEDPKRIGFFLGDEPKTYQLDELKTQYDFLRSKYPHLISLVNMFPSYVSQALLGSSYREYVDQYFGKLKPAYASLDNYPCYRLGYEGTTYYHDLEIMRETAKKNNCKILGFVQVYSSNSLRDISASDLAWQVNSLLAYGSKGLYYFYFRHPVVAINELTNSELMKINKKDTVYDFKQGRIKVPARNVYEFGSGVLNAHDQKGERFYDVAKMNAQALAWSEILIGLKSLKVRHVLGYSEPFPPVGTDEFTTKEWSDAEEQYVVKIDSKDKTQNKGYILSYFEDAAKRPYIMIVNKKHGENMSCEAGTLISTIKFKNEIAGVYSISNKTGIEEPVKLDKNNSFESEISGGGAILLRLELNKK